MNMLSHPYVLGGVCGVCVCVCVCVASDVVNDLTRGSKIITRSLCCCKICLWHAGGDN